MNEEYARALMAELSRADLPGEHKIARLKTARERGPACAEAADRAMAGKPASCAALSSRRESGWSSCAGAWKNC
jgi:hypothetical protein